MSNKRGREGGQNKREDRRSLLNLIDMGVKINGGGVRNFKMSVNIGNG